MNRHRPATRKRLLEAANGELRRFVGKDNSLKLTGSWQTAEPHLPESRTRFSRSFSDVDLLSSGHLDASKKREYENGIRCALWNVGIDVRRVSIRERSRIALLPHAAEWDAPPSTRFYVADPAAFLVFWTAVGITEYVLLVSGVEEQDLAAAKAYATVKLFYGIARNTAILRGQVLTSYASLTTWCSDTCLGRYADLMYSVKVGIDRHGEANTVPELLTPHRVARLTSVANVQNAAPAVERMVLDLRNAQPNGLAACARSSLRMAAKNVYGPGLQTVVDYQRKKLDRDIAVIR